MENNLFWNITKLSTLIKLLNIMGNLVLKEVWPTIKPIKIALKIQQCPNTQV